MFIRKRKNPSGSISIQIIDKSNGKYKVVETIACVKDKKELEFYIAKAESRLKQLNPNLFDAVEFNEKKIITVEDPIEYKIDSINQVPINNKVGLSFELVLKNILRQDPDFFDTYTVLHEYYLNYGKGSKAYNLMQKGYDRAINLVLNKNGRFPTMSLILSPCKAISNLPFLYVFKSLVI